MVCNPYKIMYDGKGKMYEMHKDICGNPGSLPVILYMEPDRISTDFK